MAIVYNRYINGEDHTWYDSSNVVYSVCYDNNSPTKSVKIVFQKGRTYLYRDVDVNDYLMFKMADSNGQSVNKYIVKKYQGVRLPDMDMDELDKTRETFINDNKVTEEAFSNLAYHIDFDDKSGEFILKLNDTILYHGVEGSVSIVNLFKSMNINYSMSEYGFSDDNKENAVEHGE